MGRSGSGKTIYVRKILQNLLKKGEKKIIYLVPEQSSFETERSLLNLLGERDFKFINVLTFERMGDFIFREAGGIFSGKITDGGRNIFMSLAIEKACPDLKLYKKGSDNIETVQMMVNTLKELKSCAVSYEYMNKFCKTLEEGTLKQKLKELIAIVKNYRKIIEQNFDESPDDLMLLLDAIKDTKILEQYVLFIDDFNDFNILQMKILEEMLVQSKDTFFTFCCNSDKKFFYEKKEDKKDSNKDNAKEEIIAGITSPVNNLMRKILKLAIKNHINISTPVVLEEAKRFRNEDLRLLERNFFASPRATYSFEPEHIFLYNASDVYDECEFVARTIRKMVIEKGFRYRDFALATRSIGGYSEKIENIFNKYEIPYFMDSPQKTENKVLFCAVFSAFEAAISNFESTDIFRYLKTGLAGLAADEISLLENYVFLWEINGNRWKFPFDMNPEGFSTNNSESNKEKLEKIEEIRKKVIVPLLKLQDNIYKKTGDEISLAFYNFLEDIEMRKNIREFCEKLIDAGELINAEEQSRIWDMLMVALDQTASALKGIIIKPKRYMELLRLAVQSEDISFIPEGLDEVMISSVDKRKISKCRAVFVIGAVEGEFPLTPVSSGVFNSSEKKELTSLGLEIYDDFEKVYEMERFISYLAVVSASDYVFISWPSSELTGGIKFPSEIVKEIKSIFPKIKVLDKYSLSPEDWLWSKKAAFDIFAKDLSKKNILSFSLRDYFLKEENYKNKINAISCALQKKNLTILDKTLTTKLFGKNIKISASQVEKFYSCRFEYFCKYGLKAKERKRAGFNSLEYGNLVHFLLEKLVKAYSEKQISKLYGSETEKKIDNLMEEYIKFYIGEHTNKPFRLKYLFLRCKKAVKILLKRLMEEFEQSLFYPVDFELKISEEMTKGKKGEREEKGEKWRNIKPLILDIPEGGKVIVEGKVDRVDIMKNNQKSYIRIIDYKTGQKKFRLSDVLFGLNMQMLLYILAIEKNGKERYGDIIPAGILYMPAIQPLITADSDGFQGNLSEKIQKEFQKKLRMNGLILSDTKVVQGMEKESKGIFIPVLIKNGKLSEEESLVTLEQLEIIGKYIKEMTIKMARELLEGEVSPNPFQEVQKKACDWCPYGSVCGFEDEREFENEKCQRKILEKKKADVLNEMNKEINF